MVARNKLRPLSHKGYVEEYTNELQHLFSCITKFPISTGDKVERFLQGSNTMLETKSQWIHKEMVVLGRRSSVSFTMQLSLTPLMLKPQKGERTSSLNMMQCNQRYMLVMGLCIEKKKLIGHTHAPSTYTRRRKLQRRHTLETKIQ